MRASRGRSRAGPRGRDRSLTRGRPRPRRPPRPARERAPTRAQSAAISSARRASASTLTISPRSPIRAAIPVVLIPGPAQRSSTRSPGPGSRRATTACEPRDWGTSSPASIRVRTGAAAGRRRVPSTRSRSEPSPGPRDPDSGPAEELGDRLGLGGEGVDPKRRLGRLVHRPQQGAGVVRAELRPRASRPSTADRRAPSPRPPESSRRAAPATARDRRPPGAGPR